MSEKDPVSSTIQADEDVKKPQLLIKNMIDKVVKVDWRDDLQVKDLREAVLKSTDELSVKNCPFIYKGKVLAEDEAVLLKDILEADKIPSVNVNTNKESTPTIYFFHYPALQIDPIESARDWDQKNRMRLFRGIWLLSQRKFEEGGKLLQESLATFTEIDFVPFVDVVRWTVAAGAAAFDRASLGALLRSAEVAEVEVKLPAAILAVAQSLHACSYGELFAGLAQVEEEGLLAKDWLLHPHAQFFVREVRIRAYGQVLRSYRSLRLDSMASAFGISANFLERYTFQSCKFLTKYLRINIFRVVGS